MKITKEVEVDVCDFCNDKEASWRTCTHCGRHACYDCREKFVDMQYSLHFSGSMDGNYCPECYEKLKQDGDNDLFNAYVRIEEIKNEWNAFYDKLKTEAELVTEFIEKNYRKRNK